MVATRCLLAYHVEADVQNIKQLACKWVNCERMTRFPSAPGRDAEEFCSVGVVQPPSDFPFLHCVGGLLLKARMRLSSLRRRFCSYMCCLTMFVFLNIERTLV